MPEGFVYLTSRTEPALTRAERFRLGLPTPPIQPPTVVTLAGLPPRPDMTVIKSRT